MRTVHAFFRRQDPAGADRRYEALLGRLNEAREHLRWNPASGRPARFLDKRSTQTQVLAARAKGLAVERGFSELRELVLKPDVLLYAHGRDRVMLLALKHERELAFQLE